MSPVEFYVFHNVQIIAYGTYMSILHTFSKQYQVSVDQSTQHTVLRLLLISKLVPESVDVKWDCTESACKDPDNSHCQHLVKSQDSAALVDVIIFTSFGWNTCI
jgi:hypothetical protein